MKNNIAFIAFVALLVGGGIGFFGGREYQKNQRTTTLGQLGFRGGSGANGAGRFRNGNGVVGTILSVDVNSITVRLLDGSSRIVLLTDTTNINKATQASVSDLMKGERVAAFGMPNSDGSVTAQNIQLNPMTREMSATPSPTGTGQ